MQWRKDAARQLRAVARVLRPITSFEGARWTLRPCPRNEGLQRSLRTAVRAIHTR